MECFHEAAHVTFMCLWAPQVLTEAALDQRLRRKCRDGAKRKALGGPDAVRLYSDPENRPMLMDMLIKNKFAQALDPIIKPKP